MDVKYINVIKAYLKLSRSFNAGLTGIAPVLGALSAGEDNLLNLFMLFLVGFFGHSYGFALNDIIDYRIDRLSPELKERPLVKKEIGIKEAWIFAISMLIISLIIGIYISFLYSRFSALIFLSLSAISITIYDAISKKYPAMDIFVALGIFFLIIFGAYVVKDEISNLTWIVTILGTLQVLFMQFIAGGLKDAEHDYIGKAKTLAIKLGVRVINKRVDIPISFKLLAYSIEAIYLILLFYPFLFLKPFQKGYLQFFILLILSFLMIYISYKLLSIKIFRRNDVRKYIGLHYYINFSLVPVMLSCINPWIAFLSLVPPLAFILSNITLHGTLLPKTM